MCGKTHLDLFSGIGGFALACRWAGIKTIAFCEIDPYCQKVLEKNFGAKIMDDTERQRWQGGEREIKTEPYRNWTEDGLPLPGSTDVPIFRDIFTFPGRAYPNPFILTGGFPCQPFSCAGKRRGKEDDRHLWPQMLRVISEARPTWVIGENVAGIIKMELDNCISDLEGLSYSVQAFIIPACAVDAPHRRDRMWIVGHSIYTGSEGRSLSREKGGAPKRLYSFGAGQDVADTYRTGPQGHGEPGERGGQRTFGPCRWPDEREWFALTGMGRVAHGVPKRVDRLKCLGNAIVPQVAYEIIRAIVEVDR